MEASALHKLVDLWDEDKHIENDQKCSACAIKQYYQCGMAQHKKPADLLSLLLDTTQGTFTPYVHEHSLQYAYKLVSIRCALEKSLDNSRQSSQEGGSARYPPDPH